ncbi:trypsin-like isoform X2 [Pieris brassicae]|uniref:trypsin-like isoform X2 n=1 Tax=Pieris brassicae TaxID=7116 RepID=UPI001E65EEB5|nr:trypsin-like isoform X2 [Pieris brassicae]
MLCTYFILFLFGLSQAQDYSEELQIVDLTKLNDTLSTNHRIIGGQPVNIEKYPYTVQVLLNRGLTCGGSLLSTSHVLTSAHCFFAQNGQMVRPSQLSVRLGSTMQGSGGTVVSVSKFVIHENYNIPIRNNDIGILFLSRRVKLTNQISLAFIPQQGNMVPDRATVTYVGWGYTNVNAPVGSTVLNEVHVQNINLTICSIRYNQLSQLTGMTYIVTNEMLCAGILDVGQKDACQGDSGGPVIYNGVVVGITSWGYSCGHPTYPGVNSRVSSYTTWITRTIAVKHVVQTSSNNYVK